MESNLGHISGTPILYLDNPGDISISVLENEQKLLLIADFDSFSSRKILASVAPGASLEVCVADFARGSGSFLLEATCDGDSSQFVFRLSSLALGEDQKIFDVKLDHRRPHQKGKVDMNGIAGGSSKLHFLGETVVERGAGGTKTRQDGRIIVIDSKASCRCSPALRIFDNDVEAGHGAVEGRLSDQELFYLQSRGIPEQDARRLIAMGYLSPIASYFPEGIREKILTAVEEGI